MPRNARAPVLLPALLAAACLQAAPAAEPDGGSPADAGAEPSARTAVSLEQGQEEDPGLSPLLLPEATLSACQDKRHLIAINERLQHDSLLHEDDVNRIASFISRCQVLLRRDAGLATGPGRHGRGSTDGEPRPSRDWRRE